LSEYEFLRLRPNPWAQWATLVLFGLIAGTGLVIGVRGFRVGWAVFAIMTPIAVYSALAARPDRMCLELASEGLIERTPFRRRSWRWQDFERFYAWQRGEEHIVVFRYSGEHQNPVKSGLLGRLDAWDGELICAGTAVEQQADLLNRWLERYVPEARGSALLDSRESTSYDLREPTPDRKGRNPRLGMSPGHTRAALMVCGLGILTSCLVAFQVWGYLWARLWFLGLIGLLGLAVVRLYRKLRTLARSPKQVPTHD
jgi:hypothetical protein